VRITILNCRKCVLNYITTVTSNRITWGGLQMDHITGIPLKTQLINIDFFALIYIVVLFGYDGCDG